MIQTEEHNVDREWEQCPVCGLWGWVWWKAGDRKPYDLRCECCKERGLKPGDLRVAKAAPQGLQVLVDDDAAVGL